MTADLLSEALGRALPVVAFLLAITVVAELADRAGVFDVAGHRVARWGRQRMWTLWLAVAALAVVCTIFLSLDTTAVLLTPVALAIARQVGASPRAFALTTLWIANTGSLLLPVSNLTNLLAAQRFSEMGVDHGGYVRLALAPAVVSIVLTLVVIAVLHRRDLARRYSVEAPEAAHDPVLLRIAAVVCVAVGPAFALGLEPWLVSGVAALVLLLATCVRAPHQIRGLSVPWVMAGAFAAMTVLVGWAHTAGGLGGMVSAAGSGRGPLELLRVAAVGAGSANVGNNLPAYLALEPVAQGDPLRLMALLVGVNAGPLVTPWASLATLLWLQRCSAAGVRWRLSRLALTGLGCALVVVTGSTLALGVVSG